MEIEKKVRRKRNARAAAARADSLSISVSRSKSGSIATVKSVLTLPSTKRMLGPDRFSESHL